MRAEIDGVDINKFYDCLNTSENQLFNLFGYQIWWSKMVITTTNQITFLSFEIS